MTNTGWDRALAATKQDPMKDVTEIFRNEAQYAYQYEIDQKLARGEASSQAYKNYCQLIETTREANDHILAARKQERECREEEEARRWNRHKTALQLQGFNRHKDHERVAAARTV